MFRFFEKNDDRLQNDVMNELKWDPRVTSARLSVTAKKGIVTLHGTVPHYFEKTTAEDAAQRVSGVRAVADEIEVSLLDSYERDDQDIAEAAANALKWSFTAPDKVKVTVEKGWVTLKGEAEWDYQRTAAKDAVSLLMGVCGVTNHIAIKSRVAPSDIKTRIEEALKRSAEDEGKNITVSVAGDEVTLSGNVHALSESNEAAMVAWNAPGVMNVENNLKIVQ